MLVGWVIVLGLSVEDEGELVVMYVGVKLDKLLIVLELVGMGAIVLINSSFGCLLDSRNPFV